MRTPVRRSPLVSVLALWLAALLAGASIAVIPKVTALSTGSSTQGPGAAAATTDANTARALAVIRGSIKRPQVSPTIPVRGKAFTVRGKVSTKVARSVTLQRRSGSAWVTVATSRTSSRGSFSFSVTTGSSVIRYRVRAPKATIAGKHYATATSSSVSVRTVGLTQVAPMASERFTLSYALTKAQVKKARPVVVQRKSGRSWVRVGTGSVTSRGAVTASVTLSATGIVRVYVPKAKIKKRTYRATSSPSFAISVAPQSVSLALPNSATVGQAMDAVVAAAPLRTGRTITIQRLDGATWTDLAAGSQVAAQTTMSVAATTAGTISYRAVLSQYNGAASVASAPVNVTVIDAGPGAPVISITALNLGVSGTSYETDLSASGGTGAITWSATGLPAGLSLSPSGHLSGTPSESGTFEVTFTATDADGKTGSKQISLTINPAVSVGTTTLPDGIVGTDYLLELTADGGMAPFTWTATGLPAGLSIEGDDTITGQPTVTGTSHVELTVTDTNGKTDAATIDLVVVDAMAITTAALANGEVGDDYSQQLVATGGDGTYTWALTSGSLPAGLTLSAAGVISGVPTGVESATFTVTATDVGGRSAAAELSIAVGGLAVTTSSLAVGTVGSGYSQSLTASGGDGVYAWSVAAGSLPDGLSLAGDGVLSGTPTAASSGEVTFTVTDGKSRTASAALSVRVAAVVEISTTVLSDAVVGDEYSLTLAAAGGSGTYSWQATGLPEGIELSNGQLVGTPVAVASASVELTVDDGAGRTASVTLPLVVKPAVSITTAVLPYAVTGTSYEATLAAGGGTASYSWAVVGLPEGLSLNADTGVISGVPTEAEAGTTVSLELTVTDAHHKTATATVLLAVRAPVSVTTTTLPEGTTGVAYSQDLAAAGGLSPYTWSVGTGLPAGLSLSTDGQLAGTPTAAGTSEFVVTATDTSDPSLAGTYHLTLSVKDPVVITTASVAEATVGQDYDQSLTAAGGTPAYEWSLKAGSLPEGLSLSAAGKLSGSPVASESTTVTVKVTDSIGRSSTAELTVTVKDPVAIATTALDEGTVGVGYSATLAVEGGTAPFTWTATEALPDGLALSEAGVLSGAPTASTNGAPVAVKVSDGAGRAASKTLTLKVSGPLSLVTTSLSAGVADDAYAASLEAAGGTGSYTWVLTGLPAGLTHSGADISGTPAQAGTYQVGISVSDEAGRVVAKNLTLVVGPAVAVATTALPHAVTTVGFAATLTAAGGTTPYTWAATGLPDGLELNTATGEITGIPADAAGNTTASVEVTVTDKNGKTASATLSLDVLVPVAVVESTLPEATLGSAYDHTLTPGGGEGPYTWSTSSQLPAGVTLSSAGRLSGTPSETGSFEIVIHVVDSSGPQLSGNTTLTLTVRDPLGIATTSLPAGTVGAGFTEALASSGGTRPDVWTITSGSLPAGLSLAETGTISGTPSVAGDSAVTLMVTDAVGRTATRELSISVKDPVAITTSSLADGTLTVAYNQSLVATGGDGAYTWSVSAGSLPAGLSLAADGTITGTPTAGGTATFTAKVTDATGRTASTELSVAVASPVAIDTASLDAAVVDESFSQTLAASGGLSPYTWQATDLPAGLSIDSSTGAISGTPQAAGAVEITFTVTDARARVANVGLTLSVAPVVGITTTTLASGVAQAPYSATVAASGGTSPYHWAAVNLPAGLSIDPDTGAITGTPASYGSATVTLTVTDAHSKTSTRDLDLYVEGVVSLAGGGYHMCALLASGGIKCWGSNSNGQLGNGTKVNSSTPVTVSGLSTGVSQVSAMGNVTCATLTTGAAKCWGENTHGQIGDGTTTDRTVPTPVSTLTSGVTAVSAGLDYACAIVAGSVKCWGSNVKGQLGDGTTTDRTAPTQVSTLTSGVSAITAGTFHTCAIISGAAKCWGNNTRGQIGDNTNTQRNAPTQVTGLTSGVTAMTVRLYQTCAVVSGAAKCWGANDHAQLGDNSQADRWLPTPVSGLTSGVTAITGGQYHTCALVSGAAKCWGYNADGRLGDGTTTDHWTPNPVTDLASGVTAIANGTANTCAIQSQKVKCWGLGTSGQLGDGTTVSKSTATTVSQLFSS